MVGDRLGILLRLGPLRAFAGVTIRSRAGYFVLSAPVPNDNDKRGDSATGVPGIVRQVTLFRTHRTRVGNRGAL